MAGSSTALLSLAAGLAFSFHLPPSLSPKPGAEAPLFTARGDEERDSVSPLPQHPPSCSPGLTAEPTRSPSAPAASHEPC